ncbi:DUF5134 domain-containing protein [Amycolatopsis sp. NPDC101161]|uniref:DUF5134 domain-containing protein n=1 Tax=Amycolatopsis sp. NPDC101161 TaxID=3363940 RepID=UPI0037F903E9
MGWALTAAFAALALPCVLRLVRLDYTRLGVAVRHGDLAELLLVVAMVAMLSPVGGPIPAAGWQAVLALTAGWFAAAWWRGGRGCAHHALSAAAMFYMVTAMPHGGMDHGPWLTMSTMDSRLALPVVAVVAAGYFVVDAAWSGVGVLRGAAGTAPGEMAGVGVVTGAAPVRAGQASRAVCRAAMGAGMGYLLLAAAL